jgi:hypothetical protein
MATNNLQVTDLDFNEIKTNLKNFLRTQSEFQDYDFEGSGLNVLLDILAYNTHYNAYYLNMVANESFLDTAVIRDSVVSHAKSLGYTPYSINAAKTIINFTVTTEDQTPDTLTLSRGFNFKSDLVDGVSYNFTLLDAVEVEKANSQYYFENLELYEGEILTYNFVYSEQSNPKSIFTLPNQNIDTKTIRVEVIESSTNTASEVFTLQRDLLETNNESPVYFLQENRNGLYQIYFGNDVIGKKLKDGNIVSVSYLITNGSIVNKIDGFITSSVIDKNYIFYNIDVVTAAFGGADRESIDEIKALAPLQYTTQNRLVTTLDYDSYIRKNYANLDSISVWGGEENQPPVYGKVFVSLKPKDGYFLSETEKQRIVNEILSSKSIVSVSSEIVDPNFDFVIINADINFNSLKTAQTKKSIENLIRNEILIFVNNNLNKFNSELNVSDLECLITNLDSSILGCKINVRLQKRLEPALNLNTNYKINFNTKIVRGTVDDKLITDTFQLTDLSGVVRSATIEEVPQSFTGITEIKILNPGLSFTSPPQIVITGDGNGAEAVATISGGKLESIKLINRGTEYTSATISIVGGGGFGAVAIPIIDFNLSTLRTVYFDNKFEKKIINNNVGSVNYDTGIILLNDLRIAGILTDKDYIGITVTSSENIIKTTRNTILTLDQENPNSIIVNL